MLHFTKTMLGAKVLDRCAQSAAQYAAVCLIICAGAAGTAQAAVMEYAFQCKAAAKVQPAQRATLCAGGLAALRAAYPRAVFRDDRDAWPEVALHITQASAYGGMLHLVWTDAAGQQVEGPPQGVSAMDRTVSDTMWAKLLQRVIAAAPMPK